PSLKALPPLVRGLSIGLKPLAAAPIRGTGGLHIKKWLWAELSAVTIPQNIEASILAIKSAASGLHLSGATDPLPIVRVEKATPPMGPLADQITAFEATRAAKAARMTELMTKAAE